MIVPALSQYTIDEGEFVRYKGRGYTWLHISQNGVVRLPEKHDAIFESFLWGYSHVD